MRTYIWEGLFNGGVALAVAPNIKTARTLILKEHGSGVGSYVWNYLTTVRPRIHRGAVGYTYGS